MKSFYRLTTCIRLILLIITSESSKNVRLSPYAFWNQSGITLAGWSNRTSGSSPSQLSRPFDLFITTNDVLYISDFDNDRIVVLSLNDSNDRSIIRPISASQTNLLNQPAGISVTETHLYVVDRSNFCVQKISLDGSDAETVPGLSELNWPYYIYVDDDLNIYLSETDGHQVLLLKVNSTNATVVAGTGIPGSDDDKLNGPYGVFVKNDGTIFVADASNDRIMKWLAGAQSGIRVAGDGTRGSSLTQLNHPTQILVDTNEYMYITDDYNHRIMRWAPNSTFGVCIVACTGNNGIEPTQLNRPHSLVFDSSGSLFVTDNRNHRVQKFQMLSQIVPYNQPRIYENTTWNTNGTTFADETMVGSRPHGIFISFDNTIYIAANSKSEIIVWSEGKSSPIHIRTSLSVYTNLFVTVIGEIYFENGSENGRIEKWSKDSNQSVFVVKFSGSCYDIFIDLNNTLYCCMKTLHQIDMVSLNNGANVPISVAGTGGWGSKANELSHPFAIFVDVNVDLYVADTGNHRILLFRPGETAGITVAGIGIPANLFLNLPTNVKLDAEKTIYIADNENHRIIRVKDNQFSCIIACSSLMGFAANLLHKPYALHFDSYGNLYVIDEFNNRIQKFNLTDNFASTIYPITTSSYGIISQNSCNVSLPCENNGTCHDSVDTESYYCLCALGWGGERCQIRLNESFSTQTPNLICAISFIKLIPSSSSPSIPWKFRRHENLHVTSEIDVNCSQSSTIMTKWTIFNESDGTELNYSIHTSQKDLFIPALMLSHGRYQLELVVTIIGFPPVQSSSSVYIDTSPTTIHVHLIELDTFIHWHDYREDLLFDPGKYSLDTDGITFQPEDWFYSFYCRHYTTNHSQPFEMFEDRNQTCFGEKENAWKYANTINSSVKIHAGSLHVNNTYQFLVEMINRHDLTRRSIGYLLVQIEYIQSPIITISCVISNMCSFTGRSYYVNPTTQLFLTSRCVGDCSAMSKIQWNIYRGSINPPSQTTQWTLFISPTSSKIDFLGLDTKNLTISKDFFIEYNETIYWRVEVIYFFGSNNSSNTFDIEINQPPKNGQCSINPLNGTILTLFTIHCFNWFDHDGIKDWIFYGSWENSTTRLMLGQSVQSIVELRLPARIHSISAFHLTIVIRDTFDSMTEFSPSPVTVRSDPSDVAHIINAVQLLNSTDTNIVGQLMTLISELFNENNDQHIELATLNGLDSTTISITSLDDRLFPRGGNSSSNQSIVNDIDEAMNKQAMIREYFIELIDQWPINTIDDLKFQSSILSGLTQSTNQLTRKTSTLTSKRCLQLSNVLKSSASKLAFEDVYFTTTHLAQCATNVFNGVNAVLQERGKALEMDLIRAKLARDDCDRSLQCLWTEMNIDEETILKQANIYSQKQTFKVIAIETNEILSSLTSALNIHLNLNQIVQIKTNVINYSLEKLSPTLLSNRLNASGIHYPLNITLFNNTILLRKILQPLASSDEQTLMTNLSRSLSLSIFDENEKEIKMQINRDDRIEFFIPRDPNLLLPDMFLQDVMEKNETNLYFNYHRVEFPSTNPNLTFALHFELHPIDQEKNISYWIIYQFDVRPQHHDHASLLCPQDRDEEGNYVHFVNNEQTAKHHSIIYGIRQLNERDMKKFCVNKTFERSVFTEPSNFTSNYELRIYQSACFYLDENGQWQSDGLIVGPMTNHRQTHCLSTRL